MAEAYLIPNHKLDSKSILFVERIIGYLSDPKQRETGLSFILNRLDNKTVTDILLQVKPNLYTQFLTNEDDPTAMANSLFIVSTLAKIPEFIIHFIQYDVEILKQFETLLSYKNQIIIKQCMQILVAFVVHVKNADDLNGLIPILVNSVDTMGNNNELILMLIMRILITNKNIKTFIECGGVPILKTFLDNSTKDELLLETSEIVLRIVKNGTEEKKLLFNEGMLKSLTHTIIRTSNNNVLERAINAASQMASCEFFATSCIESGLFEECLDMMEYPYTERSTSLTLIPTLIIIFRVTQDRIGAKTCSSLKLASKLSLLLKSIGEFPETTQAILLGIITNLFNNEKARKDMLMTKVDEVVLKINPQNLQPKGVALLKACITTFNEMQKATEEIEYTPQDIQRMAEYDSKKNKARQITEELIQTEDSYSRNLNNCVQIVMRRLENTLKENKDIIFNNIAEIEKYQHRLTNELESCLNKANENKLDFIPVGNILLRFFSNTMLDLYTKYAINTENGMSVFNDLSKNDKDVECVVKELASKGHYIPSYLIQPIQRIPRYVLLLESLIKCIPEYLEEHSLIEQCLEKIHRIANEINENKRRDENEKAMKKWNSRLDLDKAAFANKERDYWDEMGQVLVSEKKDSTVWTMVIFTDIAVLTRNVGNEHKEKWKIKEIFTLTEWKVLEITNGKLQFYKPSTNTTIEISCSKSQETEYLAERLRKAIYNAKATKMKRASIANF